MLLLVTFLMYLQLPSVDEISAHMAGQKLTTIIFFLDETFEEVSTLAGRLTDRQAGKQAAVLFLCGGSKRTALRTMQLAPTMAAARMTTSTKSYMAGNGVAQRQTNKYVLLLLLLLLRFRWPTTSPPVWLRQWSRWLT